MFKSSFTQIHQLFLVLDPVNDFKLAALLVACNPQPFSYCRDVRFITGCHADIYLFLQPTEKNADSLVKLHAVRSVHHRSALEFFPRNGNTSTYIIGFSVISHSELYGSHTIPTASSTMVINDCCCNHTLSLCAMFPHHRRVGKQWGNIFPKSP